ncbi:MAG: hypothetical protein CALGDGBN_00668 [Pseudomonadales bacterium]|nr:hypothetical protein [Pseudomonadales bacterium]
MNALLQIARKEMRARRLSSATLGCGVCLLLLAGAWFLPRGYTTTAQLALAQDVVDEGKIAARVLGHLGNDPLLAVEHRGTQFDLRYSAPSAQQAFDGVSAAIARALSRELELLRSERRAAQENLGHQLEHARTQLRTTDADLKAALAALPQGGESALGARLGQLQGELDALLVDLRSNRDLQTTLARRVAALDARLAELRAAAAELDSVEAEAARVNADAATVDPERALAGLDEQRQRVLAEHPDLREALQSVPVERQQFEARRAALGDEIRAKQARERQLRTLIEQGRVDSATLIEGNQILRDLQREYDDAAALERQLSVRLNELRLDAELRTTPSALPVSVSRAPLLPLRPDGIPGWVYVLFAALGGVLVAGVRLLGHILVDDRVRLAQGVLEEVEVPVLAVIPEYRPREAHARVRVGVVMVTLLVGSTVAAAAVFLFLYG